MKKRIASLATAALVAVGGFLYVSHVKAASVGMNIGYDFSATGEPSCATGLTTGCIKQFKVMTGTTTVTTIPAPNSTSATAVVTATNVKVGPPYGQVTFSVVAEGVAPDGVTLIDSDPMTATATVKPGKPTSFTIQ